MVIVTFCDNPYTHGSYEDKGNKKSGTSTLTLKH